MRRWLGPAGVVALGIAGGVGQGLSGLPPGWPTWVGVAALGLGARGCSGSGCGLVGWPRRSRQTHRCPSLRPLTRFSDGVARHGPSCS